jgi:DDE family transposase
LWVKDIPGRARVKVSADGEGVVSHAGVGMLREVADLTGLSAAVTQALADTYDGPWVHAPGVVFADLAAAVADGADCVDAVARVCGGQERVLGPAASTTTTWRLVDERVDAAHLPRVRAARAMARQRAWAAGAAPRGDRLHVDIDATITIDHSDRKQNAAATWKKTFGFHPLLVFLDRPDIAGGEALAGLLRPGNAGSNTAADHVTVLDAAIAALPVGWRPGDAGARKIVVRSDSAGATKEFAHHCHMLGMEFSFGFAVDARVRAAVEILNEHDAATIMDAAKAWRPAIDTDGGIRKGAWVAEATHLVNLGSWPEGTRLILRKERPHPGAQLRFTDTDGLRVTAFITTTRPGVVPGGPAGLELRHRQHARVEDRIREAKATGLRNLPFTAYHANAAWLEIIMTATDLVAWTKLVGFSDTPEIARCEIAGFRYRVLHVAARLTRSARQTHLRIDRTWRWADAIATGWNRIRLAFTT